MDTDSPSACRILHRDRMEPITPGPVDGTRFVVEVHESLPSTQALLVSEGGPDGRVVVAEHQTAGRGRSGRTWLDESGTALLFSVLLADVPPDEAALLSLAAGLAVLRAVDRAGVATAGLKWPNDVLVEGAKLAGVLGEFAPGGYAVIGIGVNVSAAPADLPDGATATSLKDATGLDVGRREFLWSILRELETVLAMPGWLNEYRRRCVTIGRNVRVDLSAHTIEGKATAVRDDGALVVDGEAILAGDVVHVRRTD